jgi:ketosteroid isomerase-like protein
MKLRINHHQQKKEILIVELREGFMKKLLMVLPLVFMLCFTFSCQQGEEVAEEIEVKALSDEDVAAIKAANDAFVQAALEGGLEATTEFYTEDTIMVAQGPMIQGRETLKEKRKALSKASASVTAFDQKIVKIDGRDDLAFVLGTVAITMAAEGLPEPMQFTGFLHIYSHFLGELNEKTTQDSTLSSDFMLCGRLPGQGSICRKIYGRWS